MGHFSPRRLNDPTERGSRYPHLLRRLLLVETLKVGQPDRLEFVERQGHFFQLA